MPSGEKNPRMTAIADMTAKLHTPRMIIRAPTSCGREYMHTASIYAIPKISEREISIAVSNAKNGISIDTIQTRYLSFCGIIYTALITINSTAAEKSHTLLRI